MHLFPSVRKTRTKRTKCVLETAYKPLQCMQCILRDAYNQYTVCAVYFGGSVQSVRGLRTIFWSVCTTLTQCTQLFWNEVYKTFKAYKYILECLQSLHSVRSVFLRLCTIQKQYTWYFIDSVYNPYIVYISILTDVYISYTVCTIYFKG